MVMSVSDLQRRLNIPYIKLKFCLAGRHGRDASETELYT